MIIAEEELEAIFEHARKAYPHECFGFLVGSFSGDGEVKGVYPAKNLTERAHDRYEMDPQDYLRLEEEIADSGLEIVGFYHSHPDGQPRPSSFDLERAWEEYFYLIVSVWDGEEVEAKLWRMEQGERQFREEAMNGCESEGAGAPAYPHGQRGQSGGGS